MTREEESKPCYWRLFHHNKTTYKYLVQYCIVLLDYFAVLQYRHVPL